MLQHTTKLDIPFPQNLPVIDNDFDVDGLDVNYYLEADLRDAEIANFYEEELTF